MSEFRAGFAIRHQAAADVLKRAFAVPDPFAETGVAPTAPRTPQPRHYSPAAPGQRPTEGWDPFDAAAEPSGFLDPIAAAHAAGVAEGQAAERAARAAADAREAALVADLSAALAKGAQMDRDALATQLRQTVMLLVARIVGEAGVDADLLAGRIAAAADVIADSAESAMIRMHPADVAMMEGRLAPSLFAVGDASLERGAFVIESASTLVEDGPRHWLDQLAQAIDRVPLPPR